MVKSEREFASPHSTYKFVTSSQGQNYTYWSTRCQIGELLPHYSLIEAKNYESASTLYFSDLGEGWSPAALNSPEELTFIIKGFKNIRPHEKYWIGGSTDGETDQNIEYSAYFNNASGIHCLAM